MFVNSATEPSGSSAFRIDATGASGGSWTLRVGNDKVSAEDSDGNTHDCPHSDPASGFWVNVSKGTVEGSDCPGLDFAAGLGTIDQIDYANAENITGTYRLLANDTRADIANGQYGDTSGPFLERAIYGTWIEIDFECESLVFRTERQVIPGEDDD
jgi:hypothetical protein